MPRTRRIAIVMPLMMAWLAVPAVASAVETAPGLAGWAAQQRPVFIPFYLVLVAVVFAVVGNWTYRPDALGPTGPRMVLFAAALPPATLLATTYGPAYGLGAFMFAAIVLTGIAEWFGRGYPVRSLGALALLEVALVLADQLAGAPLSPVTVFGYNAVTGPRHYGLGNEMAALAVGAALAGGAAVVDGWPEAPWREHFRRWGFPALSAVVIAVAVLPRLGANAGVAVWGTCMLGVGWWRMTGRRVTWSVVLAAAVLIGAILAVAVAFDLRAGAQTHIGKAWLALIAGDLGTLGSILRAKAVISWGTLTSSWTMALAVAVLAGLAWVRLRPGAISASAFERHPALTAALDALLVGVPITLLSEDSGILIPALAVAYVGGAVLLAMRPVPEEAAR